MNMLVIENQTRDNDIVVILFRVWREDIIDHAAVETCQLLEIFLYCLYCGRCIGKNTTLGYLKCPYYAIFFKGS